MKQFSPQIMKWVIKLFFVFMIMAGVTYLFYLNPDNAIFYLTPQKQLSAPMAFIVLLAFGAGAIITAVVAILLGLHQKIMSWSLVRKLENYENIKTNYVKAASLFAAEDYSRAEKVIKKILSRDAVHIPANILLAKIKEQEGEIEVAISILEKFPTTNHDNAELILLLVKLYRETGSELLAYEKLKALLEQNQKNRKILSLLIEFGEKIKATADVAEYKKRLLAVTPAKDVKAL